MGRGQNTSTGQTSLKNSYAHYLSYAILIKNVIRQKKLLPSYGGLPCYVALEGICYFGNTLFLYYRAGIL